MLLKLWRAAKVAAWIAAFAAMCAAPYLVENRSPEALLALMGILAFFTYNQCVLFDSWTTPPDPNSNPVNVPGYGAHATPKPRIVASRRCMDAILLGVRENATKAEIIAAFRRASKQHHPDAGGSAHRFRRISLAKDRLLRRANA